MGYEVAEQRGWKLPDAIFYPTGMIGMWRSFDEMEAPGWIGP
jgi:threonine synthase